MEVWGHGSARSHLALGPFCVAAGGPEPTDDPKGTDRHHPSAMVTDGKENSKKCCSLRLCFAGSVKLNGFHQVSVYIAEVLLCSGLLLQTEAMSSRPYSCCICHNAEKKKRFYPHSLHFFLLKYSQKGKKKCYAPFGVSETYIVWSSGSANVAFWTVPDFTSAQDYSVSAFLRMASILH